jgi:cell division protein FtsB
MIAGRVVQGMLGYVLAAGAGGSGAAQHNERIVELQREKDRLTLEYRDKRKKVDDLKDDLQKKISEYSRIAQSGECGRVMWGPCDVGAV